ncbi:MAG: DUF1127 domain-containing protein [Alphaproteobacteria bacterium]
MTDMRLSTGPQTWDATQAAVNDAKRAHDKAVGAAISTATLRLGRIIKATWDAVLTWRRNEKAMNELSQCSDWMLADIGIRREQIRDAVHHGAERHQVPVGNPVKPVTLHSQPDNDQAGRKVA